MDNKKLYEKAIGSRLKQLSERLMQDVSKVYKDEKLDFEPSFFIPYCILREEGPMSVKDMAPTLGVSQPASSQVINKMIRKGLLIVKTDDRDKRKKVLSLSKKGIEMYPKLEAVWQKIKIAHTDLEAETGVNLPYLLDKMEKALDEKNMYIRILNK